jgi:hypothetical protein
MKGNFKAVFLGSAYLVGMDGAEIEAFGFAALQAHPVMMML